jgi:hypothetical protein
MKIFEFLWDNGKLSLEMLGFFVVLIGFFEIKKWNQGNKTMRLWRNVKEIISMIIASIVLIFLIAFSKDFRDALNAFNDDA